jgi:hypothetical protein
MRLRRILCLTLVLALLLHACMVLGGLALIHTVRDINDVLDLIFTSMRTIRTILHEGKEIQGAAKEGGLIAALADRIPTLVREGVEESVRQRIGNLSGDMKGAALDLRAKSLAEDHTGARRAYSNLLKIYDEFLDLCDELLEVE